MVSVADTRAERPPGRVVFPTGERTSARCSMVSICRGVRGRKKRGKRRWWRVKCKAKCERDGAENRVICDGEVLKGRGREKTRGEEREERWGRKAFVAGELTPLPFAYLR